MCSSDLSCAIIINNNQESQLIQIINGVKQGGILSPFLFNLYINELLEKCLEKKIGAQVKLLFELFKFFAQALSLFFCCHYFAFFGLKMLFFTFKPDFRAANIV